MRCFEITALSTHISTEGGPFTPDGTVSYWLPDEAEDLLEPILAPYDRGPIWFLDKYYPGQGPTPWAHVCLDREYALGGHLATSRPPDAGIKFGTYARAPDPLPDDYVPGVGVIFFLTKAGLEQAVTKSLIFEKSWEALEDCSPEGAWLALLDPLPEDWLAQTLEGDREHWRSRPAIG